MEYGLVEIKDDGIVTELDDFKKVEKLYQNPLPTDDGGYKASSKPSVCPSNSSHWNPIPPPAAKGGVKVSSLPSMPQEAQNYMKNGAGTAVGFNGKGSHDETREAGFRSWGWDKVSESEAAGGSTASSNSPSTPNPSKNAKNGGNVLASSSIGMLLFGTSLLAAIQSFT